MGVFKDSRYANSTFLAIQDEVTGVTKLLLDSPEPLRLEQLEGEFTTHTVQAEETLDLIAYIHYQDERLWRQIAEVNDIFFFYDIVPGQTLIIPDKNVFDQIQVRRDT